MIIKIKQWLNAKNKPEKLTDNPYINARRAWNVHNAGLMKSLQLWQFLGLASLFIAMAAVGGIIFIGSQSKFIPLVFQQDASHNILSITKASEVSNANVEDLRVVAANFIENIRMVSADVELQKKAVFQVYSYLNQEDAALTKTQEFYNGNNNFNPFERAANEIVSIEIRSVLQQTESSWQVNWIETVRNRDGSLKQKPFVMKAIISLYQDLNLKNASNEALLKNPHLIYIRDYNWSRDLEPGVKP